ncbi:MAG: FHA domain-containing protein [Granulosicoccus sp.]
MTTIIVLNEGNEIDEFEFEPAQSVIEIGRRTNNDVCIPDLSVSGLHARINFDNGDAWIEDLHSTNGSYINGRLISRQRLNNGDEIVLGKVLVRFQQTQSTLDTSNTAPDVIADTAYASETDKDSSVATVSPANVESHHSSENKQPVIDDDRLPEADNDVDDDEPMTLSQRAKVALGRVPASAESSDQIAATISDVNGVTNARIPEIHRAGVEPTPRSTEPLHPLEGVEHQQPMHDLDSSQAASRGAVIEIKNGAKSGQILPIDKPVTTLGRPGIQIAAIMRKPDGYFLMHIESDDSVDRPTLNQDSIGDEPVMLHSGDELNVAGIDVEFMLS